MAVGGTLAGRQAHKQADWQAGGQMSRTDANYCTVLLQCDATRGQKAALRSATRKGGREMGEAGEM